MAVHVDEIHTDIVPAQAPSVDGAADHHAERLGAADSAWREAHAAALAQARRVAAWGFDD